MPIKGSTLFGRDYTSDPTQAADPGWGRSRVAPHPGNYPWFNVTKEQAQKMRKDLQYQRIAAYRPKDTRGGYWSGPNKSLPPLLV